MPRYIDADALIEAIKNELWDWETLDGITSTTVLKQTITDIQNAPTAGVVEVVRCKDCKWFVESVWCCKLLSNNYEPPVYMELDDFCSCGERRE